MNKDIHKKRTIKFTDQQWEEIDKYAKLFHITKSSFIRISINEMINEYVRKNKKN